MNVSIMQPYFFPYLGYFQLISASDIFVFYDNTQWRKGGWINRNRILSNGEVLFASVPMKKDSYTKNINERTISDDYHTSRKDMLIKIENAYHNAPYFSNVFGIIENAINFNSKIISTYTSNTIFHICKYLDIKTKIIFSSYLHVDRNLRSTNRVISIIKKINGTHYINPIGGQSLYMPKDFISQGISLSFIEMTPFSYQQPNVPSFIPNLSIIDVMMNNSKDKIISYLKEYKLITYHAYADSTC